MAGNHRIDGDADEYRVAQQRQVFDARQRKGEQRLLRWVTAMCFRVR